MQKLLWSLKAMLIVVLIASWMGGWVTPVAGAKKPPSTPAPVAEAGQTQCWDEDGLLMGCTGTGQDGAIRAGVAWPVPSFTNCGDGTVWDNLTGSIWLLHASCFGAQAWEAALQAANALHDSGTPETTDDCGLSDGSAPGDWRMRQFKEMHGLVDLDFVGPPLSNAAGTARWLEGDAFIAVEFNRYWTSSTYAAIPGFAWGL